MQFTDRGVALILVAMNIAARRGSLQPPVVQLCAYFAFHSRDENREVHPAHEASERWRFSDSQHVSCGAHRDPEP